jgi:uncharacterized protein (UPF0212 family)
LLYTQASLDLSPSIGASHVVGMTGMYHHTQLLLVEVEVSWTFCPNCSQTSVFPTSTSWVVRITGLNHTWLLLKIFKQILSFHSNIFIIFILSGKLEGMLTISVRIVRKVPYHCAAFYSIFSIFCKSMC